MATKKPAPDAAESAPEVDASPRAPAPKALPGVALRHLRALGHDLRPVVMLGKEGITDALVAATRDAIRTHELIKVKIQSEAPVDRHEAARALAEATDAVLAQVIGRTFLLYKRRQKNPKIVLPKARG